MKDQTIILVAIGEVRAEAKMAEQNGATSIELADIMVRLSTLYALLDVSRLVALTDAADPIYEEKEVA